MIGRRRDIYRQRDREARERRLEAAVRAIGGGGQVDQSWMQKIDVTDLVTRLVTDDNGSDSGSDAACDEAPDEVEGRQAQRSEERAWLSMVDLAVAEHGGPIENTMLQAMAIAHAEVVAESISEEPAGARESSGAEASSADTPVKEPAQKEANGQDAPPRADSSAGKVEDGGGGSKPAAARRITKRQPFMTPQELHSKALKRQAAIVASGITTQLAPPSASEPSTAAAPAAEATSGWMAAGALLDGGGAISPPSPRAASPTPKSPLTSEAEEAGPSSNAAPAAAPPAAPAADATGGRSYRVRTSLLNCACVVPQTVS